MLMQVTRRGSWVIFRTDEHRGEIYVTGINYYQSEADPRTGMPGTSNNVEKALAFDTAREAYDWAGKYESLESWRVGSRPWAGLARSEAA